MTEHHNDVRTRLVTMWDRVHPGIVSPEMWPRITYLTTGDALAKVPDGFATARRWSRWVSKRAASRSRSLTVISSGSLSSYS